LKIIFVCAICGKKEDVTEILKRCNYELSDTAKVLGWERLKRELSPPKMQKRLKQEWETLGFVCPNCQS